MTVRKLAIRAIAPPAPAEADDYDDQVWLLNLDQIESHTGRLLSKQMVARGSVGTSTQAFDAGNVLYSKLRPYLNKVFLPEESGFCTTELVPLRPNPNLVRRDYLAAYLRSPKFLAWVDQQVDGAKMPRVSMKVFWAHEIELPTLDEQKRIAAILDKADSLRRKRQRAIRLADDFLRAVFIEMFGDPVTNPKGWPIATLPDIASKERYSIVDGPFGSALTKGDYLSEGVPIIRIKNISSNGEFLNSGFLYISEAKWEENRRSAVQRDDILISRVGTLGNCCIYPGGYEKALLSTTGVCKVTIDETKASNIFVHRMILMPRFQKQIAKSASTSVQPYFNLSALKSWKFGLPPIELQQQYAQICKQTTRVLDVLSQQESVGYLLSSSLQDKFFA